MTATIRRHKGEAAVVSQDNTLHLREVSMKRWLVHLRRLHLRRWGVVGAQLLMLLVPIWPMRPAWASRVTDS